MSAYVLPALSAASNYAIAGIPTVIIGGIALAVDKTLQARMSAAQSAEMRRPSKYPLLIHIAGTADLDIADPDQSFSFRGMKRCLLDPMGFPSENICPISQRSTHAALDEVPFHQLSTEEYFNIANNKALQFLQEKIKGKAGDETIDLIITGLSQGGALAIQLTAALLQDPDIARKIDRLLLIPVHATIKGSTANAWPQWMRDYIICLFYPVPVCNEFHLGSNFLIKNRAALNKLKEMQKEKNLSIEFVHDGLDTLVHHKQGKVSDDDHSWQVHQLLSIALPMIAVSIIFDIPLAGPLLLIALITGFWNHALGMNNPKIGRRISNFISMRENSQGSVKLHTA